MIHVQTGSRLHFGLLAPAAANGQRFGSVGMMIDLPGIHVSAEPADAWSVAGPLADRVEVILHQVGRLSLRARPVGHGAKGDQLTPLAIRVHRAAPEHIGLGTGTQLSLAVARLLAEANAWDDKSAPVLAQIVNRGARSAIGIHGFDHGGYLVDGGKAADRLAPLVARMPFPSEWRIVLILPHGQVGTHGEAERDAFARLDAQATARTEALCRLTLLGMLPTLAVADFQGFSESCHAFNRLAGEAFRSVQGGVYAGPQVEAIVETIRGLDVAGVGQSSWGPTIFAVVREVEQAAWLVARLNEFYSGQADVFACKGLNDGARVGRDNRTFDLAPP